MLEQIAGWLDEADQAATEAPIRPVPRDGSMVCTYQQEGLWFEHQLHPSSTAYNIGLALRLRGIGIGCCHVVLASLLTIRLR